MTTDEGGPASGTSSADRLLELARRARQAGSRAVLGFLAVNDSLQLAPYRQSALWLPEGGVRALSGVVQVEANAPYVHYLARLCGHLAAQTGDEPSTVTAESLPPELASEWADWLPAQGLWLPLLDGRGGLLLLREPAWSAEEQASLLEWAAIWTHAWRAAGPRTEGGWWRRLTGGKHQDAAEAPSAWWRRPRLRWLLLAAGVALLPVRLSVLAPGELVPARPAVIRAPLEGVLGSFQVKPNEAVKAGQPLFRFDDAALQARLEVARQSLAGSEAEYRQAAQLAVSDPRYKAQLAPLMGKVEERRAEAEYLQGQLERAHVLAPEDGIVLFDDPSEWIGRPVSTGERIMRLARAGDVELEAWLDLGDAIPLPEQAEVRLYLNASPLQAIEAKLRYMAFEAVQRPDGRYAYRVRARLDQATEHRVGLKGTAKLSGERVPLIYWVLRRPLALLRQVLGW
ncbi:MAG: secretion protein HylD [Burkholderiales bacterium PBB2]|nr:MAG: secretion protein HylD [Burkholderiales bacterium PBB2]